MKTGYSVGDAMTKSPVSISEDCTLEECCILMKEHNVGSLVIKQDDKLKGMLTTEQIIHSIADGHAVMRTKASEIMNNSFYNVSPELDIHEALVKMNELEIRQIPVMNKDVLVGLLTMKDVLKIEPALFDLVAEKLELREEENKPTFYQR